MGAFPRRDLGVDGGIGILEAERMSWHRFSIRADDIACIEEVTKSLGQEPIRLGFLEEAAIA